MSASQRTPTALIADDEPLLRAQLRARLATLWPDLHIAREAENGRQVAEYFANATDVDLPSVCFLDIHMPGMTGLEAARHIGKRSCIVFVTAFDQYAVEAFERGAIDYVLKPFNEERLKETVARLKERLSVATGASVASHPDRLDEILARLSERIAPAQARHLQWIKASVGSTVRLIPVDEILYFQSDEKYTRVVLEDSEVLIRKPIKELLEELDPARFWQIHRASIVNTRAIAGVVRGLRDQADLKLKGRPEVLTVSRAFTHLFKQM